MKWCFVVAVALASLVSTGACSAPQTPEEPEAAVGAAVPADPVAAPEPEGPAPLVAEEFAEIWKPWKGDLDGIVEGRVLRILVTYNSTFYFADRGRQGGVTYELGRLLEEELNERFGTGALRIDVVFIPVTRDRLLPALVEGHGDIAASNLTITDERRQRVAFSEPLGHDGKEIVVTGPGAPPVTRLEDLSGLEVYVRASSSFAESLRALNASFAERGLRPVEIVPVDEHLETEDILEMANAGSTRSPSPTTTWSTSGPRSSVSCGPIPKWPSAPGRASPGPCGRRTRSSRASSTSSCGSTGPEPSSATSSSSGIWRTRAGSGTRSTKGAASAS